MFIWYALTFRGSKPYVNSIDLRLAASEALGCMILPEFLNDAGESASNPLSSQTESTSGIVRSIQAKILWSSDTF